MDRKIIDTMILFAEQRKKQQHKTIYLKNMIYIQDVRKLDYGNIDKGILENYKEFK